MKNQIHALITLAASMLLLPLNSTAVEQVQPSISGNDLVLTWPGKSNEVFLIYYRETFETGSVWTALSTNFPASSSNQTVFVHTNGLCPGGSGMAMMNGGGDEELGANSCAELSQKSASSLPPWAEEFINFTFPKLPWDAKIQAKITESYPGLLPQLPWNEEVQQEIVATHEAEAARLMEFSSGSTAMMESSSSVGCPMSGFYVVYEELEDPDGDELPNWFELLAGTNPLEKDTNKNGIPDGDEDPDGDGASNFDEYMTGGDPQYGDNLYPPPPLAIGTVFWGEDTYQLEPLTNSASSNAFNSAVSDPIEVHFLDADGELAFISSASETTNGELKVCWFNIWLGSGGEGGSSANANEPPLPSPEQLALLRQANGETRIGQGQIGRIKRELYEQLEEGTVRWQQFKAEQGLRKTERILQEIETGVRPPPSARFLRSLRANMVTQKLRLGAATKALSRFGGALGRYLPLIGGIMIAASASDFADQFVAAAQDYAIDIQQGNDESGSAAIVANLCEQLAPFSQNIVLYYLLR